MTPQSLARCAGGAYAIVTVCGLFADLVVRARTVVPDDGAATAEAIASSPGLFAAGILADLLAATAFLVAALLLRSLFEPVHRTGAAAYLTVNAVGVAVMTLNVAHLTGALALARTSDVTADAVAVQTLVMLELHGSGYRIAGLFYGVGLLILGWLALRSGFVPRPLGLALLVASTGYPANLVLSVTDPAAGVTIGFGLAAMAGITEIVFFLWLLVRGVSVPVGPLVGLPMKS